MSFINPSDNVFVAGHNGMVGKAVFRELKNCGYKNIIVASREELDLTSFLDVNSWFVRNKPDVIPEKHSKQAEWQLILQSPPPV